MPRTAQKSNDWTVMFFFASDNALAPLLVSQLKAIKEAGFQKNTEVLVYFDPNEPGVASHIFNVNAKRKQKASNSGAETMIGDGNDPYLFDLGEDDVSPGSIDDTTGPYSRKTKKMLSRPDQVPARHALENFLGFCRENHPARHYLLFLVGHGMIVANDRFLPDDNPPSSISLRHLGEILSAFCDDARASGGELEVLLFNSCSMSSIEVAYQLRDTANLMLASQGITFVGNWPYRQLLKEFFRTMNCASTNPTKTDEACLVKELAERFYFLCLSTATDFVMAGESFDLCLTQLRADFFAEIRENLPKLVREMKAGLSAPNNQRVIELIQLAHLKSQSFYQEDYSDLLDFCNCLAGICDSNDSRQLAIGRECSKVVEALSPDPANRFAKLIVRADHFGWRYQYANGLSIYFPWVDPIGPQDAHLSKYRTYDFNGREFGADSWATFLRVYFDRTKRLPDENAGLLLLDNSETIRSLGSASPAANNLALAVTNGALDKPTGAYDKPTGASGQDCSCPSIKNYPTTVGRFNGKRRRVRTFSVTKGFAEDRPHFLQK